MRRPRRLRANPSIRNMVRETRIAKDALVYPVFVIEGSGICEEIKAMPGQYKYSIDCLHKILERLEEAQVCKILLFGIPQHKDAEGSGAYAKEGIIQRAVRYIKKEYPSFYVITDICMCEYTSHGHCGIVCGEHVHNDKTLAYLAKIALSHAEAGADMLAPSDMMDGRIGFIRQALDGTGYEHLPIMAYSAKYASSFYGPFREAACSAPGFGDRKGYQMDYHNAREAWKEVELDIEEGADIIMVKPAMNYLDIVRLVREKTNLPVAAYSVSGEYAMLKAAAQMGFVDEKSVMKEMAVAAVRAGANIYITYYAIELAECLAKGEL